MLNLLLIYVSHSYFKVISDTNSSTEKYAEAFFGNADFLAWILISFIKNLRFWYNCIDRLKRHASLQKWISEQKLSVRLSRIKSLQVLTFSVKIRDFSVIRCNAWSKSRKLGFIFQKFNDNFVNFKHFSYNKMKYTWGIISEVFRLALNFDYVYRVVLLNGHYQHKS